jgi:hypothetical protein
MKVRVYRNLTKNCWSVQSVKTGRVIAHALSLSLNDAKFVIQKAGQARVRKQHKKYVHAFVVGTLTDEQRATFLRITYNPYIHDTFVIAENQAPIEKASHAAFEDNGKVWVS